MYYLFTDSGYIQNVTHNNEEGTQVATLVLPSMLYWIGTICWHSTQQLLIVSSHHQNTVSYTASSCFPLRGLISTNRVYAKLYVISSGSATYLCLFLTWQLKYNNNTWLVSCHCNQKPHRRIGKVKEIMNYIETRVDLHVIPCSTISWKETKKINTHAK